MNKNLELKKNSIVLFICNMVVLVCLFLFKNIFTKLGYFNFIVNTLFVINIIIFVVGFIFNVLFIKKPDKYSEKKSIKIIILVLVLYLVLNIFGTYFINGFFDDKYDNISNKVFSYCNTYGCDKYSTKKTGNLKEFIINKTYFDFNNVENKIKIVTKYDSKKVIFVRATIYSKKESFSEDLIKDVVKDYFANFDCEISSEKIKEAFDKRFDSYVSSFPVTYRVSEIYNKKNELTGLKTTILLRNSKSN